MSSFSIPLPAGDPRLKNVIFQNFHEFQTVVNQQFKTNEKKKKLV